MTPPRSIGVNLLPVPIRRERATRRARAQGLVAVGGAIATLVVVFIFSIVGRSVAESKLDAAQGRLNAIEAQKRQYDDVPGVYGAIKAAQLELSTAMSQEVLFSAILADLGNVVPADVSVSKANWVLSTAAAGGKTPAPGGAGAPKVGKVAFAGEATSMPAVARLMDALAADPNYLSVHLDSAKADEGDSGKKQVVWSISAELSEKALSNRYPMQSPSPSPSSAPTKAATP